MTDRPPTRSTKKKTFVRKTKKPIESGKRLGEDQGHGADGACAETGVRDDRDARRVASEARRKR